MTDYQNAITVLKLLLTYFAVAWVLIGVSILIVRSLWTETTLKVITNQRTTMNNNRITARQDYYKRVA